MSSPVVNTKEWMKITKHTKTKIVVGSVVKAKVGYLEKITRKGITRSIMKVMIGCVQSVVEKNKFLFLFEDGQKKDIGSCLLVDLNKKEEVEMEEAITIFPKIEEVSKDVGKYEIQTLRRNVCGTTDLHKLCCAHYRHLFFYDFD